MVLAVVGLCVASGADYAEAAALGNVAGGLEVEKFGVATLTLEEILRDLLDHHGPESSKILDRHQLAGEITRRRITGQTSSSPTAASTSCTGDMCGSRQAAALGDFLVVGLNSDSSVRRLKGPSRPLNPGGGPRRGAERTRGRRRRDDL